MVSVVLWGVLLGGVLYSHLVFFPAFLLRLPESSVVVNGEFGMNEAVFWMTIHPMLILSLVFALVMNWAIRPRRKLIAISFAVYLAVIAISAVYFIPELQAFAQSPASEIAPAEWQSRANRWIILSWLRGVLLFVSIGPLLIALTRPDNIDDAVER